MMFSTRNGFITLSSVLVVSAILLVLAIGATQRSLFGGESVLMVRHASAAQAAARGCAEYALIELTRDLHYRGDEQRVVGDHTCTILPFTLELDGSTEIRTVATVSGHTQRVIVDIDAVVPDVSVAAYRLTDSF